MPDNKKQQETILELRKLLDRKDQLEKALVDVSSQFIVPGNFDNAIHFALEKILECSGADHATLMQVNTDNPEFVSITHERCRDGTQPIKGYLQNICYRKSKWFNKIQREIGYIAINNITELPPEASFEKSIFKKSGISASVITNFTIYGNFRGNLAVHCKHPLHKWNQQTVNMLIHISVFIQHSIIRTEAEKKLIAAKIKAEENDKMKTNFLANLSHEIRTPLNGIMGFSKLLVTRNFPNHKQAEYANLVERNSKQLLSVIDDLIDLSKLESNNINIRTEKISLLSILEPLFDYFRIVNRHKPHVDFKLLLPKVKKDITINTDPQRLKQIIENLLKNAFQFTDFGFIHFGYEIRNTRIYIFVEDTGKGIAKKNIPKLFDRFWQTDSTEVRTFGGNGLGLPLANDFARLLGGKILVSSKLNKGSKFTLSLPGNLLITEQSSLIKSPKSHNDAANSQGSI